MNARRSGVCIPLLLLLVLPEVRGAGLATSFVDVVVVDVPLGVPTRLEDKGGKEFLIWNTQDSPITVHVQVMKPESSELRGSAEPIEDPGWVQIRPSTLTLASHATGHCEVILTLPKTQRLRHRIFQAMIWSRSEPVTGQGFSLSAGLKSRLQIRTKK